MLPVVMVTSLDPGTERVKGIEAGADDFLTKPIEPARAARPRAVAAAHQGAPRRDWPSLRTATLEQRVREQVAQLERLGAAEALLLAASSPS